MARIRSIHPGLMTDEAFMTLTVERPLAVVLYLGLLMESDDNGLFEWKPLTLKARILPAVSEALQGLLDALVQHRFITPYEIDGRKFGAVRNFCRFQRPKKPNFLHPYTDAIRQWVAMKAAPDGTDDPSEPDGSPPVPHQDDTSGENPLQREEGGGNRRRETTSANAAAVSAPEARATAGADFEGRCRAELRGEMPAKASFRPIEAWLAKGCPERVILQAVEAARHKASISAGGLKSFAFFDPWIEREWRESGAPPPRGRVLTEAENADNARRLARLRELGAVA